jgi:hypothetical protein
MEEGLTGRDTTVLATPAVGTTWKTLARAVTNAGAKTETAAAAAVAGIIPDTDTVVIAACRAGTGSPRRSEGREEAGAAAIAARRARSCE